jgi:L-ascorbate metabolism protein UlaG (beta-lactamase superfamily)
MTVTLDWLGCATFRLTIGQLVVFLDGYIDRVPSAPPVGLSTAEVERADFVLVGHSHFDHLAGAEVIARNTGARIIGSFETCRVMRGQDVPPGQLLPAQGGEHFRLGPDVTVRVYPSLHSCVWASGSLDTNEASTGQLDLTEDEREQQVGLGGAIARAIEAGDQRALEMQSHLATAVGSRSHGGALAYVIETPERSIFYQDTSGCWTGVLDKLRPDVAILAAAGRGNLDGEPIQGSLAQFVGREAELIKPSTIVLGHHDNWMPPVTREGGTDVGPIREELARTAPGARLVEPGYMEATRLF